MAVISVGYVDVNETAVSVDGFGSVGASVAVRGGRSSDAWE